ncbi:conserved hypothetical protein, partial [Trichinella spiralis]|uniref:hypothetical protein n=1 Tax=Trichinella spiralis TaxID=6334 RepID=UPI0001EFB78C
FKEWCKEKVPKRTARSKSQTAQSGTREDKRHGEACFDLVNFFNMAVKEKVKTGRHEADRGRHEADRGRHVADRGRHEADRGPHEAEQEKTKFLGPQFCRSGIGILRRAKLSHKERRQVEKGKIGERLWIGWIGSFVGQLRSLVNSVRCSSEVSIGTLEKIDTIWQSRVWKASSLQRPNTQT